MLKEITNNTKNKDLSKIFLNTRKLHNKITPSVKNPKKRYVPLPVRKEFSQPITLAEIKNIDYKKDYHFKPENLSDKFAHSTVKFMRQFADIYFQKDYNRRAVVLETVAAIPGMIGGLFRHLYSLRKQEDNGIKIHKLLLEAENERQHLLAFLSIKRPNLVDSFLIHVVQPVFFGFYSLLYCFFPRMAHRFVGYLEEEAIRSYDAYEMEIIKGNIANVDAPRQAKVYWKMPDDAKLIDLVRAIRADEAAHRDANHELASEKPFSMK